MFDRHTTNLGGIPVAGKARQAGGPTNNIVRTVSVVVVSADGGWNTWRLFFQLYVYYGNKSCRLSSLKNAFLQSARAIAKDGQEHKRRREKLVSNISQFIISHMPCKNFARDI